MAAWRCWRRAGGASSRIKNFAAERRPGVHPHNRHRRPPAGCSAAPGRRSLTAGTSAWPPPATEQNLKPRAPLRLPGLLLFGRPDPILASKLPLSEDGQRAWETIVIELSSKQALEKCHQTLVAGLRLIQPEERVMAIAAALQEVAAREKRLYAAVVRR